MYSFQKTSKMSEEYQNNLETIETSTSEPMTIDGTLNRFSKLSVEGREKCKREGRCFRCRAKGHLAKHCTANSNGTLENNLSSYHLVFPICIMNDICTHVLIDSGASTSFIDKDVVQYYNIPSSVMSHSEAVETIDGQPLNIDRQCEHLKFIMNEQAYHHSFRLIKSPHFNTISLKQSKY
ncbi:hypothetical protein ROZALSC1DRAFT_25504 [Rozella allomycis CSF55]|uniref:CCHC-type domain-containing protein n=1 Tax=Rozella allomycis (strain CSF55) TaxID=988480 RepID=A0A4V1IYZ1_ROZAC|nr:hypothetical protein ROZALSC1DRAFT_25504 [Rozella allomycis CSF55]